MPDRGFRTGNRRNSHYSASDRNNKRGKYVQNNLITADLQSEKSRIEIAGDGENCKFCVLDSKFLRNKNQLEEENAA